MSIEYSIVATTFNDEKSIIPYLDNVSRQTLKPKEIVIADGGSYDSTVEIIERYAEESDIPIIVLSGKRLNIAEGYNHAIKNAHSEWIGITGIGNTYEDSYFEKLSKYSDEKEVIYSPIRGLQESKFSKSYINTFLNGDNGNDIGMPSNHGALVKKYIFKQNGYFYENFIYAGEDAEFYNIVKEKGYAAEMVPNAVVYWHIPQSFREYRKQVKNYTIGDMQILKNSQIIKSCIKKIGAIIVFLMVVLFSIIKFDLYGVFFDVCACVVGLVILKIKNPQRSLALFMYGKIAPIYIIFCNYRYMSTMYKVKRLCEKVD